MTTATRRTRPAIDLETVRLSHGSHTSIAKGMCVMELASYLAREPWSDAPQCASPTIAAFLRSWNDSVDDDFRQRLKPYAQRVIGTRTTDADEVTRAWMATDWLVRVQAPAWLELAGLKDRAAQLRAFAPLTSPEIAIALQDVLDGTAADAAAAGDASAGDAAWDAARDAAGDASAGDAAWDASAWVAAGDAAWAAAGAASAWVAARDAARAAAGDASAGDAAWERLRPTVEALQVSAFGLLDRMIAVGRTEDAVQEAAAAEQAEGVTPTENADA